MLKYSNKPITILLSFEWGLSFKKTFRCGGASIFPTKFQMLPAQIVRKLKIFSIFFYFSYISTHGLDTKQDLQNFLLCMFEAFVKV